MIKRIGILTGGGDAPGLNAVIRAVVLTAHYHYDWQVVGIRQGFDSLLLDETLTVALTPDSVRGILARGGTILGAVNRGNPFQHTVTHADGSIETHDLTDFAVARLKALEIDALIAAGGDGTMMIANTLVARGARIVGVPKTIDNDLSLTDVSFGFDTAILTATEALDKLQTTAESHHRVMVLEVMGRHAGWIALQTGIAGGADVILIPEIPYDIQRVCDHINAMRAEGRHYSLVVVAEGAAPSDGAPSYYIKGSSLIDSRLGGVGYLVGNAIAEQTSAEVRVTVLGHVQRGGTPTPRDRWLATRFGAAAVHLIAQERWGYMTGLHGTRMEAVPMAEAMTMKRVPADGDLVMMARDLGIVLG